MNMDSATLSAKVQMRSVFPTLVAEIDHPDPEPLNALLLAFIRRIRDEAPPEQRATTISQGWLAGGRRPICWSMTYRRFAPYVPSWIKVFNFTSTNGSISPARRKPPGS